MGIRGRKPAIFFGLCFILLAAGCSQTVIAPVGNTPGEISYARCNLRTIGTKITWINWQATPTFVAVGTRLGVTRSGDKASLVNLETKEVYTLDIGADGEAFLEKFVTKTPVDVKGFPPDVQAYIRSATAKVGMTKEQVYIAMGPPTILGGSRTNAMTYENIMAGNLWVYYQRRMRKNMGVAFDPVTQLVSRTESIQN